MERFKINSTYTFYVLSLTLMLSACGGGGDSGGGDDNPIVEDPDPIIPVTGVGTSPYEFFNGNSLIAINPDDPTFTSIVDTGAVKVRMKTQSGTVNLVNHTVSDFHKTGVLYDKNGSLFYVSAEKSDGLISRQISNEESVCLSAAREYSLANPLDSRYVYKSSGPDTRCGTVDDIYRMVTPSMSNDQNPLEAKEPLYPIHDISRELVGWLVNEAGNVTFYDKDFLNPEATTNPGTLVYANRTLADLNVFLLTDGNYYFFNALTASFEGPFFAGTIDAVAYENNDIYFVSNNSLYKKSLSVTDDAILFSENILQVGSVASGIYITDQQVLLLWEMRGDVNLGTVDRFGLISVARSDGAINTTIPTTTGGPWWTVQSGNRVYTSSVAYDDVGGRVQTSYVIDNGVVVTQHPNASWVGVSLGTTIPLSSSGLIVEHVVELYDEDGDGSFAGSDLLTYETSTGNFVANIGTIPNFAENGIGGFGLSEQHLGEVAILIEGTIQVQHDIYYADLTVSDSLQRVTDTVNDDELPAYIISF